MDNSIYSELVSQCPAFHRQQLTQAICLKLEAELESTFQLMVPVFSNSPPTPVCKSCWKHGPDHLLGNYCSGIDSKLVSVCRQQQYALNWDNQSSSVPEHSSSLAFATVVLVAANRTTLTHCPLNASHNSADDNEGVVEQEGDETYTEPQSRAYWDSVSWRIL